MKQQNCQNNVQSTMYNTLISSYNKWGKPWGKSWFSYSTFSMKAFILFWKAPLPQKLGLKCDKKARMLLRLHWLSYFFSRHLENERHDFLVTLKLEIQNYIWRGFCVMGIAIFFVGKMLRQTFYEKGISAKRLFYFPTRKS